VADPGATRTLCDGQRSRPGKAVGLQFGQVPDGSFESEGGSIGDWRGESFILVRLQGSLCHALLAVKASHEAHKKDSSEIFFKATRNSYVSEQEVAKVT
jgi:hypothetical protein